MSNKEQLVICEHPDEFKTGVRILMRTLRSKDGGKVTKPDRVAEKIVTRSVEEFYDAFGDLLNRRVGQERIYATVDARNMSKAIRIFKQRQLDADYFDPESRDSFYVDIFNRWISALQSPGAADTSFFMVDVDHDKDDEQDIRRQIAEKEIELLHEYKTKNGVHLILYPFNPKLVTFDIQQNGMMLLAYNNYQTKKL